MLERLMPSQDHPFLCDLSDTGMQRARAEVYEAEDGVRGVKYKSWQVETAKRPILNASESDKASKNLDIPLPEICFGRNSLVIKHTESQLEYVFDGLTALKAVDSTGEASGAVKVAYAADWAKSRKLSGASDPVGVVKNWDWTYTTTHPGRLEDNDLTFEDAPNHPGIPLAQLASQNEPILFFDEVTLFEDELHDNGIVNLVVKVRVMPSCLFVLSRLFLRVDGVLFRIYDVRLYHAFGTNEVIRECKGRQNTYEAVKQRLPTEKPHDLTPLTDSNWVANMLGMLDDLPAHLNPANQATTGPASLPQPSNARIPASAPWSSSARVETPTPASSASKDTASDWQGLGTRLEVLQLHG